VTHSNINSIFRHFMLLSLVVLLGSWHFFEPEQNCEAQKAFENLSAEFKTYSKDDFCLIIDVSESLDKNSPPTTFKWLISDGSVHQGVKFQHCFEQQDQYDVTLLATSIVNQMRLVDSSYYQVEIGDFAIIGTQKGESFQCYFDAEKTAFSKYDAIKGYYWDFGDGAYACSTTHFQTSHQYAKAGTYLVRLIVVGQSPSGKEKKLYSKKSVTITR